MSPGRFVFSVLLLSVVRFSVFARGADGRSVSCGGTLSGISGEIFTPDYPHSYPTNITCIWRIKGGNSHINITFLDFELEGSPSCKAFDYLELGYRHGSVAKLCGSRSPWMWVIPVEGKDLDVKFYSDTSLRFRGFKLTYAKYDINGCLRDNGGCDHYCNFKGGKKQCSCRKGYYSSWYSRHCRDINECLPWTRAHNCKKNQVCVNTPGSFRCVCKTGYRYNGKTNACEEFGECQKQKISCPNGRCRNVHLYGGFSTCDCNPGYVRPVGRRDILDRKSCEKQFCPNGWKQFGTSCYFVPWQKASWISARAICKTRGADLVAINSKMENMAVWTMNWNIDRNGDWIGLFSDPKNSSSPIWNDGSRLNFTNWSNDGLPGCTGKHQCVRIQESDGRWMCENCTLWKSFVCEKKAAPTFKDHERMKRTKLQFTAGDDVTLSCDVFGKPKPEIVWYFNGKPLEDVSSGSHDYQLTVKGISTNKEGEYTCTVGNVFGSLSFTYNITVRDDSG